MVIPIEESLIYVRPLYLRAQGSRIPELTRVIVAYNNQIVMEPTLDAALARLFGGSAAPPTPETEQVRGGGAPDAQPASGPVATPAGDAVPVDGLATEAQRHYDAAVAAQRAGDWAKYGEELRLLGQVLARMRR
jgi:uncharacterized membrane protein (UPF0182 family)